MTMFARHKTLKELQDYCRKKKWKLKTKKFDEGSDYVSFDFKIGRVIGMACYAPASGVLLGHAFEDDDYYEFNSNNDKYESESWFQKLLLAVYVPKKK